MTSQQRGILTAEDLLIHPDGRYAELVAGALRVSEPPGCDHGAIAVRIATHLANHVGPRALGTVLVESGYVLARNPDTVRGPDVSFLSARRTAATGIPAAYFSGPPDLAVEIRSPSDPPADIEEKVGEYLNAGSRLVWVVDPYTRSVSVHRPDRPSEMVTSEGHLDGEDTIPGFSCRVADLFP